MTHVNFIAWFTRDESKKNVIVVTFGGCTVCACLQRVPFFLVCTCAWEERVNILPTTLYVDFNVTHSFLWIKQLLPSLK